LHEVYKKYVISDACILVTFVIEALFFTSKCIKPVSVSRPGVGAHSAPQTTELNFEEGGE